MISKLALHLQENHPKTASNIFWAVMHFPLFRECLSQEDLLGKLLVGSADSNFWRLGNLARTIFELRKENGDWNSDSDLWIDNPPHLSKLFDELPRENGSAVETLSQIGQWAVSLDEKFDRSNWDDLLEAIQLQLRRSEDKPKLFELSLISFSSLLPEPDIFIPKLLTLRDCVFSTRLATSILLGNYFEDEILLQKFETLINSSNKFHQAAVLDFLHHAGKTELAEALAKKLAGQSSNQEISFPSGSSVSNPVFHLTDLLHHYRIYQYAGDGDKSQQLLFDLDLRSNILRALLDIQSFKKFAHFSEIDKTVALLRSGKIPDPEAKSLIIELNAIAYQRDIDMEFPSYADNPYEIIGKLKRSINNEPHEVCAELAETLIDAFAIQLEKDLFRTNLDTTREFAFMKVLTFLIENDFVEQALKLAELFHEYEPANLNVLKTLRGLYHQEGKFRKALELALIEQGYQGIGPELCRDLYELYDLMGIEEEAYRHLNLLDELGNYLSSDEKLKQAVLSLNTGRYSEAINLAGELMGDHAALDRVNKIIGEAWLRLGEYSKAMEYLQEALEYNPDDPITYHLMVEAARKEPTCGVVFDILQNASNVLSDSATIQVEFAKEYFYQDQIADGIPFLQTASSLQPDTKLGAIEVGSLLESMGDLPGAFEYYQQALSSLGFDEEIARLAVSSAILLEEYNAAEKLASDLCNGFSPCAGDFASLLIAKLKGGSLIISKENLFSEKDLDLLNKLVEQGARLEPNHPAINLVKAELLAYSGDYASALRIMKKINTKEVNDHWIFNGDLGVITLKLGDFNTAVAALRESLQANPDNKDLEIYLAEANLGAGLIADAIWHAQNVVGRSPGNIELSLWMADILEQSGVFSEALDMLLEIFETCPEDDRVRIRIASLYFADEKFSEASSLIERLYHSNQYDMLTLNKLMQIYLYFQEWKKLSGLIEDHLELLKSENADLDFALSLIWQKAGDLEKAFDYSQRALEKDLDNIYLLAHQSDLLYLLNKPRAALSLIEQMLNRAQEGKESYCNFEELPLSGLLSYQWKDSITSGIGGTVRKILFLHKLMDHDEAFLIARNAFENEHEGNDLLRCVLAELAVQKGEFEFACELLDDEASFTRCDSSISEYWLDQSIRINILLDRQDELQRMTVLDENHTLSSEKLCAAALDRLLAGEWMSAYKYYEQALSRHEANRIDQGKRNLWVSGYDILDELMETEPYWIFDLGSRFYEWDKSITHSYEAFQNSQGNLALKYGFLKLMINAAVWEVFAESLQVQAYRFHRNQFDAISDFLIEKLLEDKRNEVPDLYWQRIMARADIIFSDSAIKLKDISERLSLPEDIDLITAVLWRSNKHRQLAAVADKLSSCFQNKWQLAMCYFNADPEKGFQIAAQIMSETVPSPVSHIVYGMFCDQLGDYSDTYQAYKMALEIWPEEINWQEFAARLALKEQDYDRAIIHLQKAIEYDPHNSDMALDLAKLYLDLLQSEKAIELLEPFLKDDSENLQVFLVLGEAYLHLKNYTKAFELVEKAKSVAPFSVDPYLLFAKICSEIEKYEAGLRYARKALSIDPDNASVIVFLSNLLEKSGNADEAFGLLEKVIVSGNDDPLIVSEFIHKKRKLFGSISVLNILEQMREENQLSDVLSGYLAEAFFESGRIDEAEREALRTLKNQEKNPKLKYILARINQARGHLDLAAHYTIEAIKDDASLLEAYLLLAEIYKERRQISEALGVYKQAINVRPGDYLPYYHAGLLLRETNDYEEAEIMLRNAAKLAPEDLNIRRQLGAVVALNLVHHAQEERTIL